MKSVKSQFWFTRAAVIIALLSCANVAMGAESPFELVKAAGEAMTAGEYDRAAEMYRKAREAMPQSAEIAYNLGVAHYRQGEYQQAADAFRDATSLSKDGSLRSRSIYNLGNAAYAQSLNALKSQGDPSQSQNQLEQATGLLKDALENYKAVINADPGDEDARANAEMSHRFLKRLQELKEQLQQQQQSQQNQNNAQEDSHQQQQEKQQQEQQQNQQNQPDSDEQQQQQQQQPQKEQEQPSKDQQSQTKQSQSADQPQEKQQAESSDDDPARRNDQQQLDAQSQPKNEEPPHDQGTPVQHQADPKGKKSMSRQEAERLLQAVRDKERKRRLEMLRREAAKYAPAEKDW